MEAIYLPSPRYISKASDRFVKKLIFTRISVNDYCTRVIVFYFLQIYPTLLSDIPVHRVVLLLKYANVMVIYLSAVNVLEFFLILTLTICSAPDNPFHNPVVFSQLLILFQLILHPFLRRCGKTIGRYQQQRCASQLSTYVLSLSSGWEGGGESSQS